MITETLMRPGSGTVELIPDTPSSITKQLYDLIVGVGSHVVITPVRINPSELTDAQVLGAALWTGRVVGRPSRTSLEMLGISSWLDTHHDSDITRTSGTPTQWVGDLVTNGISTGTVSGGSNVTRTFKAYAQTRREALDAVATLGGWEYEFQPDFTVDAGTSVFRTDPLVVITDRAEGPDGQYIGLLGGLLDQAVDAMDVTTKVVALGRGTGESIVTGSATQSVALKTQSGGTPTLIGVINSPTLDSSGASSVASTTAAANANPRNIFRVGTASSSPAVRVSAPITNPFDPGGSVVSGGVVSPSRGSTGEMSRPRVPGVATFEPGEPNPSPGTPPPGLPDSFPTRQRPKVDQFSDKVLTELKPLADAAAGLNLGRLTASASTSTTSQFVRRYVRPGDNVYVHDIRSGLVDDTYEIIYRGETINPMRKRVLSMSWPVERGLGVYLRTNAASPVYYDLTPYVQWEDPGAFLDVGDRSIDSYSTGARSNPAAEARIAGDAGTWTNFDMASANWTINRQPQWRYEGDRVWLRGTVTRINSNFAAGADFAVTGSGDQPPTPGAQFAVPIVATIAALTPDAFGFPLVVDNSTSRIRAGTTAPVVAINDVVVFDGASYPMS